MLVLIGIVPSAFVLDLNSITYQIERTRDATLHLSGELTEEQRQQLLTVAGKCPIHKLMTAVTTEVTTTLAAS